LAHLQYAPGKYIKLHCQRQDSTPAPSIPTFLAGNDVLVFHIVFVPGALTGKGTFLREDMQNFRKRDGMAVDFDYESVRFLESFGLVTAKSYKGFYK